MEREVEVMGRGRWRRTDGSSAHGAGSACYGKREMEEFRRKFYPWSGKWRSWEEENGEVWAGVLPMGREVPVMGRK